MKTKWSLNALLHNDRFLVVVSLIAAVIVWVIVSFGPANMQSRELTTQVTVDLTNTLAGYNDLRVIGENTFTVNVTVEGPRSVIFGLSSDDIVVRPSLSDVQGPGKAEVHLSVSKTGIATDYTIVGVTPASVTVNCDYWVTAEFPLTADVSSLVVADEEKQLIGDVVLDTTAIPDGYVRLEGPRSVINQISTVVAKAESNEPLARTTRFSAALQALDANGAVVDLSNCEFLNPSADTIELTVPVWVQKQVKLTYELLNVPAGINADRLVTLSTDVITLVGEEDELNSIVGTISNLGTFDFDRLKPENNQFFIALNVPSTVKVLEDSTVTVALDIDGYTTKTLSYSVDDVSDVTVENLPEGLTLTLQKQTLSNIVLCGKAASLRRITAKDIELVLDASSNTGVGSVRYNVRVTVPKYPDVWVYYGTEEQSGYRLYGTVE